MSKHVIADFGRLEEALALIEPGDSVSVHPDYQGLPGLYHVNEDGELVHDRGPDRIWEYCCA